VISEAKHGQEVRGIMSWRVRRRENAYDRIQAPHG